MNSHQSQTTPEPVDQHDDLRRISPSETFTDSGDLIALGDGHHAEVFLLGDGQTVCKRFRSSNGFEASDLAALEYEALGRIHSILHDVRGVGSPRPISLDARSGQVLMTYCPGEPITTYARDAREFEEVAIREVARALWDALVTLHEQGCPVNDLSPHNILYEPESQAITLVDFTDHPFQTNVAARLNDYELALSNFAATAISVSLHRANITNARMRSRLRSLSAHLIARGMASRAIRPGRVLRGIVQHLREANGNRSLQQRIWFSTLGGLIFLFVTLRTVLTARRLSLGISSKRGGNQGEIE